MRTFECKKTFDCNQQKFAVLTSIAFCLAVASLATVLKVNLLYSSYIQWHLPCADGRPVCFSVSRALEQLNSLRIVVAHESLVC
jgi:hypothetical protein